MAASFSIFSFPRPRENHLYFSDYCCCCFFLSLRSLASFGLVSLVFVYGFIPSGLFNASAYLAFLVGVDVGDELVKL